MGIYHPTVMPGQPSRENRLYIRRRIIIMTADITLRQKSITCWMGKPLLCIIMNGSLLAVLPEIKL